MASSSPPPYDALSAPSEIIERILFLASKVHVYAIPPLSSNKGHQASAWTSPPSKEIFTARLRVLESSNPSPTASATSSSRQALQSSSPSLTVSVLLEDPNTGELFAGAPYTVPAAVEAAVDSSRFFAIRVVGEGNRKAVLGIGFEERSEALDFNIALQEARKVLALEGTSQPAIPIGVAPKSAGVRGKGMSEVKNLGAGGGENKAKKGDWTLKEGEVLHLDIGGKVSRIHREDAGGTDDRGKSIEPPSGGGQLSAKGPGFQLLPPPPSAKEIKADRRRSREVEADVAKRRLEELGFDDGEFGEFQ